MSKNKKHPNRKLTQIKPKHIIISFFTLLLLASLVILLYKSYEINTLRDHGQKTIGIIDTNFILPTANGESYVSKGHFVVNDKSYSFENIMEADSFSFRKNQKLVVIYDQNAPYNNIIELEGNPALVVFFSFLTCALVGTGIIYLYRRRARDSDKFI